MRFTAALTDERSAPAGAADAGNRQFGGGKAADPPARHRSRWQRKRCFAGPAPAPQHQGYRPALLGRQLQAAGSRHRGPAGFADHGGEAAVTKPFLHHRQDFFVPAAFRVDQPVRVETRLRQRGSEQIAPGQRPEHRPFPCPRSNAGNEQAGGRLVAEPIGRTGNFMQGGTRQPPAFQPAIHLFQAEGQTIPFLPRRRPFDRTHCQT